MTLRSLSLRAESAFLSTRDDRTRANSRRLKQRTSSDIRYFVITIVTAAIVWCWIAGRTSWAAWQVPPAYSSDALEVLAHLKAAGEWGVVPTMPNHVHRLGAPFGAEWSEYPAADDVLMLVAGQLARVVGLGVASNLLVVFAQMSAAGAFFFAVRWLGHRREWATAGGLLFAFSYHNVTRGLPHLSLILTYTVPLALLSCWLIARSRRLTWCGSGAIVCYLTALAAGIGNPYNLFLYLQLLGWALIATWLVDRRGINVRIGLVTALLAVLTFFIVNADVWLANSAEGAAPLMARNYGGVEHYALKPIELLLPPANHRLDAFAFWGHRYLRWSDWQGEPFSPYLGVFGGVGLGGLLIASTIALLRSRARSAGLALQATWILLFSVIGGVNSLLALFLGLQIFRGTNRYSVFLLALGLTFFVSICSRRLRRSSRILSVALAVVVAAAGLWEEIPRADSLGNQAVIKARFTNDQNLGAEMEKLLPAGSMVFQLPFLEFPEARPINRLEDYELFRPYLHTATLRFTYGALKYRARSRWYREYASLPVPELVARLEANGFAAIYINRRGYADNGDAIVSALAAAGRHPILTGANGQQVVVRLQPKPKPVPPVASEFTFGQGWNNRADPRANPRWANGPASVSYFNPYPYPIRANINFRLSAEDQRHVAVQLNGVSLVSADVSTVARTVALPDLLFRPGINRLDLISPEPAIRTSQERSRLHAFALNSAALSLNVTHADSGSFADSGAVIRNTSSN
jgi:hypothetical protein